MKKIGIIIILLIILGAVIFGFLKFSENIKKSSEDKKPQVTQQQNNNQSGTVTLNNISNAQILNLVNGSMSNVNYTFKSVLSKQLSNGQLNVSLLGFMEQDGKYITQDFSASIQASNGSMQIVPGSLESTGPSTSSSTTYSGSPNIAGKESAITTVVQYLNSSGYNVNATDWGIDAFPDQTVGQYTGYLVHVYETFDGNPTSVAWFLVGNNGTLYNAGSNGTGPITAL